MCTSLSTLHSISLSIVVIRYLLDEGYLLGGWERAVSLKELGNQLVSDEQDRLN